MNETVIAKLLKLGYVRHVMLAQASGGLQSYVALLTCLLRRPCQAHNLTLQVSLSRARALSLCLPLSLSRSRSLNLPRPLSPSLSRSRSLAFYR